MSARSDLTLVRKVSDAPAGKDVWVPADTAGLMRQAGVPLPT
jgi:hypothetical protein